MDIGWGEMLLLALVALLIFGPDKLPRAAADAGRFVRRVREMAGQARTELQDSAGVDVKSITEDLRSVTDLHPRKLVGSAMAGLSLKDEGPGGTTATGAGAGAGESGTDALTTRGPSHSPSASGDAGVTFDPDAT